MRDLKVGFIGAGGIARAHAYALSSLKFYYDNVPEISLLSVASSRTESRESFASNYGFKVAQSLTDFSLNEDIEAVFILGPNKVHFEHLLLALKMPSVKYIYLEKPVCTSEAEEEKMRDILNTLDSNIKIQVGFQFLQTAAVREALPFWKSGKLGKPLHFNLKYYHGDYLQSTYREKRVTRLTPAPDGGAMADLGCHGVSLLMAFLGEELKIVHGMQSGTFTDVPTDSDLFSSISLIDPNSKAVGNLSSSRISSGSGDLVDLEIYAEKGVLRFNSHAPDYFEYFQEENQQWIKKTVGSNYNPITSFPSGHVPAGWLRALVHAHYIFLTGNDNKAFVPDLAHGLAVQRVVRETANHIKVFRENNL